MSKVTLQQILESLVAEDTETASAALHEWFVEQSKKVHSNLVSESNGSDAISILQNLDPKVLGKALGLFAIGAVGQDFNGYGWSGIGEWLGHEGERTENQVPGLAPGQEKVVNEYLSDLYDDVADGITDEQEAANAFASALQSTLGGAFNASVFNSTFSVEEVNRRYGDSDEDDVEESVIEDGNVDELPSEEPVVDAEPETVEDRVEDLEAELEALKAEFAALTGVTVDDGSDTVVTEETGGEFLARAGLSGGGQSFYGPFASQEEALTFAKAERCEYICPVSVLLPRELAFLKADENYGKPEHGKIYADIFDDDEMQKQAWEIEGETEEGEPFDPERWDDDDEYREYLSSELDFGTYDVTAKHFPHFYTNSGFIKVTVGESVEDFADLEESFKGLETVSDKLQNAEGAQVGSAGKVAVNTKGTLPSHKGADRVGGKPVEVKGKSHKGFDREPAPKVKTNKVADNQLTNAEAGQKDVKKEGDKAALLNKKDGFGSDSPKSPIGGGASDLRGKKDFKRK